MYQQVWLAVGGSVSGPNWRIAILKSVMNQQKNRSMSYCPSKGQDIDPRTDNPNAKVTSYLQNANPSDRLPHAKESLKGPHTDNRTVLMPRDYSQDRSRTSRFTSPSLRTRAGVVISCNVLSVSRLSRRPRWVKLKITSKIMS